MTDVSEINDEINITEIPLSSFAKYVYLYSNFAPNLAKLEQKKHKETRINIGTKVNVKDLVLAVFSDYEERSIDEVCELFPHTSRLRINNILSEAYRVEILSKVMRSVYVRGRKYPVDGAGKGEDEE